ncbi:TonB-dependent receptor [Winogradskyella eckloniae]|uniref:TonB-dependent receptor plug domain-containing protein n=1 Tax=Winogradskyella eckloniae TaxID=1089306 RepID=UPI00156705F6|nr:TonB-dependent receptor [Winogradskyella eckloniae]NRD19772.1 TonB-dependent receptor [Winogradskyella eckloniae]
MIRIVLCFLLLCFYSVAKAQTSTDSIQRLDEVVLSDVKLKRYNQGYKLTVLNDSILRKNGNSLTDVLRFNSNIYFKENGYGMVSSASFRGTNASQTAVIWNGININSQLNGQVDFNTISAANYNAISIRSGGGSVQYGSGAIGGSVHLSNELDFTTHINHRLQLGYGSYDTENASYNLSFGNSKWSGNVGVSYVRTENDYRILGTDEKNENGAFNNLDLNLNLGYVLSQKDVLKIYHQNFRSDRAFSSTLLAPSNSKYETEDYRSMLEWAHVSENFTSSLKAVHLLEQFKYFENKDLNNYSIGQAKTWLIKHNYMRNLSNNMTLSVITDYSYITAEGNSYVDPKRNAFSATALLNHQFSSRFRYNLNVRKDVISDFKSPLVFAGDLSYRIAEPYTLKFNASKNFRVPTFNDLYWHPGGNLDLEPEESFQFDLGHQLEILKSFQIKLNMFYIETSDLIQWRPNTETNYWNPVNIANAKHYGLEVELGYSKQINAHHVNLVTAYSYTETEDVEKNQPLYYVPLHKGNTAVSYNFKSFTAYYQHLFTGEVDIIGGSLDGYDVGNLGCSYVLNTAGKLNYILDLKVNNIYNTYYENVALRPMPNRNFNIKLTLKF